MARPSLSRSLGRGKVEEGGGRVEGVGSAAGGEVVGDVEDVDVGGEDVGVGDVVVEDVVVEDVVAALAAAARCGVGRDNPRTCRRVSPRGGS